jgi:Wax ester synthase-like Acyl-CoA acyltransferase domain
MPVDRLTAENLLMLWPDEIWPQEIRALAILDASRLLDPGGSFRIEALRDVVAAWLHLVPRFRQLLHVPRRGLGGPLWVDAPAFNLSDHVRVVPLPEPGDEAALLLDTGVAGKNATHARPRSGASHGRAPCGNRIPAHPVPWVWPAAAQVPQFRFGMARTIVAGIVLALAGLLLSIATHWVTAASSKPVGRCGAPAPGAAVPVCSRPTDCNTARK